MNNTEEMTFYEYIAESVSRIPEFGKSLPEGIMSDAMKQHLEHSTLQDVFDSNLGAFLSIPGEHPVYTLSYEEDAVTPKLTWAVHDKEFWNAAVRFVINDKIKKMGL